MKRCKAQVLTSNGFHRLQCQRSVADGTDYCRQHHPDSVTARRAKRNAAWQAKYDARYHEATAREQALILAGHVARLTFGPSGSTGDELRQLVDYARAIPGVWPPVEPKP